MKTLVLGATPNPERYAYKAIHQLLQHGHEVVAIGIKNGSVAGIPIQHGTPHIDDIHTVTLYLGAAAQESYCNYIVSLKPQRIIFNPGTENPKLYALARQHGIMYEEACTLVLLASNAY